MAKTVIKYLTKPNIDVVDFIYSFTKTDKLVIDKEITSFLREDDNFALIINTFSKINGLIYFSMDEERAILNIYKIYLNIGNDITLAIEFLRNKYKGYRMNFKIDKDNRAILPAIKKYHPIQEKDKDILTIVL